MFQDVSRLCHLEINIRKVHVHPFELNSKHPFLIVFELVSDGEYGCDLQLKLLFFFGGRGFLNKKEICLWGAVLGYFFCFLVLLY